MWVGLIGSWLIGCQCGGDDGSPTDVASHTASDTSGAGPLTGDTGDTAAARLVPVTVTYGEEVVCADPAGRDAGPFERTVASTPRNSDLWIWAGGDIAADIDGDGWIDRLTPNELGVELYRGSEAGPFEAVGQQVFGALDLSYGTGGSVVDYDGDGDLDVYVTRFQGDPGPEGMSSFGEPYGKNRLLQNRGDGTFDDVTDDAGVDGCGYDVHSGETGCCRTMASSWGDIDGDGDLDLFVGNYGWVDESGIGQELFGPAEPSFLYLNRGDGTFEDVSDRLPQTFRDGYTYAGGFFDLNDDGHLDLYTVNDFGRNWPNHPLLNRGDGTFIDDHPVNTTGLLLETTGMGLGIGDLNGDGIVDLAIPAWNKNHLMLSSSVGWIDRAMATRFDLTGAQKVGWGSELADFDNDGDLDLVQQYGHVANENPQWENAFQQPDALYVNVGTPTAPLFEDQAVAWGIADDGVGRGVVVADFNADGWLDIGKRDLAGPNVLYLSRCGDSSWVVIDLEDPSTLNRDGIGAKITVEAGGLRQVRWVVAGGTGYGAGAPPEVHVGLGSADVVDAITVRWPDGATSRAEAVPARRVVTLTR